MTKILAHNEAQISSLATHSKTLHPSSTQVSYIMRFSYYSSAKCYFPADCQSYHLAGLSNRKFNGYNSFLKNFDTGISPPPKVIKRQSTDTHYLCKKFIVFQKFSVSFFFFFLFGFISFYFPLTRRLVNVTPQKRNAKVEHVHF